MGDQAFRKGRFDDAIKAYDQAFNVAVDESNATEAVRTQVKASQVLEEQKQHGLAAQRLIEVSKNYPTQSLSASAHLRGCWNFAQTISPESRNTRTQFIAFLREHLALWTKAATADQARIYLGSQLESEKDWRFAFEQYLDVSEQKISDVTNSIRRCSNNYLTEQSRTQNSTKSLASKIIEQIETKRVTLGNNKDAADQLLMTQIEIDLLYETCRPNPSYTSRLNSIVLSSINKVRVNALRAISISLSNPNEALTLIGKLGSEAADLVELSRCDAYVRSMIKKGSLNDRETQTAHTLRLALIQRSLEILDQQPQSDQKRTTRWMVKKSEALVALNQNSEALLVLQDLKKTLPKSATIQMQLARTMTTIYRDKDPKKALNQWRLVAARLKSHTSNWYEAKYFVALLLIESGEKKEANKLLRYIQAIPPGWENSTRKREFETLLKSSR